MRGNGTLAQPFDWQSACAGFSGIQAGNTLWLASGVYSQKALCSLIGSQASPIVVRALPGAYPIIDGGHGYTSVLSMAAGVADVTFRDLAFRCRANTSRRSAQTGSAPTDVDRSLCPNVQQTRVRFINCESANHGGEGFDMQIGANACEVYGCIAYHNGWTAPDRGHGHGIYYQQNADQGSILRDSVFWGGFSYGVHAYTTQSGQLDDVDIEGVTVFATGILHGAGNGLRNMLVGTEVTSHNPRVVACSIYSTNGAQQTLFKTGGLVFQNNYVGGVGGGNIGFGTDATIDATGSTVYGTVDVTPSGLTVLVGRPLVNWVSVRPNAYAVDVTHPLTSVVYPDRRIGIVTVFNWQNLDTVDVDVTALVNAGVLPNGRAWKAWDVQNLYANGQSNSRNAPIASGTYNGEGTITLPMPGSTDAVETPDGTDFKPPVHTAKEFNCFVLEAA